MRNGDYTGQASAELSEPGGRHAVYKERKMYEIGAIILYGNTGVCEVTEIGTKEMCASMKGQLYYTLSPLYKAGVIYTPVENSKVFMRPIISRDKALELIDNISAVDAEVFHSRVLSQLTAHYERLLSTHECGDLVALLVSLYEKRRLLIEQKRKFGAVDERFLRRAEELLFGELAAALEITKDDVPNYILTRTGRQIDFAGE